MFVVSRLRVIRHVTEDRFVWRQCFAKNSVIVRVRRDVMRCVSGVEVATVVDCLFLMICILTEQLSSCDKAVGFGWRRRLVTECADVDEWREVGDYC